MNGQSAVMSLAEAWYDRAEAAHADLLAASTAPALFTSEFVQERVGDYTVARAWWNYWLTQSTGGLA